MKRSAILIGTNTATSTPLRGVDADIQRLYRHLTSDFGGAWEQSEIKWYAAPTNKELRGLLAAERMENPDLLMIAFSGHGLQDPNSVPFICLRDGHNFPVSSLNLSVARQITIIDACRATVRGILPEGIEKTAGVGDVSGIDEWDYRGSCRELFDNKLRMVADGRVILQSCSPGQTSDDLTSGGLFTHSLITSARALAFDRSNGQQAKVWQSICKAFSKAEEVTLQRNINQLPTSSVWGQGSNLPFFVA